MLLRTLSGPQIQPRSKDGHPLDAGSQAAPAERDAGTLTPGRSRTHWTLVILLLLSGAALRLYFILDHSSYMQSDEALVGLATQHVLTRGDLPVFFWGEERSGALITYLVAPFFHFFGVSNLVFKIVTGAVSLLLAYLFCLLARQAGGDRAGLIGLALAVFCPPFYQMWSVHGASEYLLMMVLGVVMLLLCNAKFLMPNLSPDATFRWPRYLAYGLLGLAAGVGFWVSPLIVSFIAAVWVIAFLRDRGCFFRWTFVLFLLCFAVGSVPALIFNVRPEVRAAGGLDGAPNWVSYTSLFGGSSEPVAERLIGLPGTLLQVGRVSLPVLLGGALWEYETGPLRRLAVVVLLCYWLAAILYALAARVGLLRHRRGEARWGLQAIDVVALQFVLMLLVFAISPYRWLVREPRYLIPLFPLFLVSGALLVDWLWVKQRAVACTLMAVVLALNVGLTVWFSESLDPDHGLWPKDEELLSYLVENGIRHPIANYWIAYSTAFETGEEVIPVPIGKLKFNMYPELFDQPPSTWYIFRRRQDPEASRYFEFFSYGLVGEQWSAEEFSRHLLELGVPQQDYQAHEFKYYTLFNVPAGHLDPTTIHSPGGAAGEDPFSPARRYLAHATRPGDALILNPAQTAGEWDGSGSVSATVYTVPDQVPVEQGLLAGQMKTIVAAHERLFLLLGDTSTSDPDGDVQRWLDEQAHRSGDQWLDGLHLVVYGSQVVEAEELPAGEAGITFGEVIELDRLEWSASAHRAGDVVALTAVWRAREPVAENLKAFVHLLDGGGQLVAQRDSEPVAGRRPTSTWSAGELIQDRYGVLLPAGLHPGEYRLILGLYDPATGERLPVASGTGQPSAGYLAVGTVRVIP